MYAHTIQKKTQTSANIVLVNFFLCHNTKLVWYMMCAFNAALPIRSRTKRCTMSVRLSVRHVPPIFSNEESRRNF